MTNGDYDFICSVLQFRHCSSLIFNLSIMLLGPAFEYVDDYEAAMFRSQQAHLHEDDEEGWDGKAGGGGGKRGGRKKSKC
jgi:hypothetical protein